MTAINGRDLIAWGFQPGEWFKQAVATANAMRAEGADDAAILGDPEFGWGWCADRFDIIQTDWIGSLSRYLEKTGRRYRK